MDSDLSHPLFRFWWCLVAGTCPLGLLGIGFTEIRFLYVFRKFLCLEWGFIVSRGKKSGEAQF